MEKTNRPGPKLGSKFKPRRQTPLRERFLGNVEQIPFHTCWEWVGAKANGYGVIGRGRAGEGNVRAHVYSWEIHNGPIPKDMCVLHKCENRGCVNPDHLFLGKRNQKFGKSYPLRYRGPSRILSLEDRFFGYVALIPFHTCWEWTGKRSWNGYGRTSINRRQTGAHQMSWEIHNGKIPDGMCVLHKCDNRGCVNPNHLFLGTKKDNTKDMMNKGRGMKGVFRVFNCKHCGKPKELRNGQKICRPCDAERGRRRRVESKQVQYEANPS